MPAMTPITMATIAPIDRPAFRGAESGVGVEVDASEVELLKLVGVDVNRVELLVAVEEDEVASRVPGYMVVE